MDESFVQMRDFMIMTESLIGIEEPDRTPVVLEEDTNMDQASPSPIILADLRDVVFKLRAFMEDREGDLGLGIEMGMQRAAEMIENVIARYSSPDQGE